ncbi:Uncharacterised protein [Mycobacteroides abscessus subsp. abscessus]|nr:Uncharacterised protein [Mycobacteroides abscessus subsp. abscessus]
MAAPGFGAAAGFGAAGRAGASSAAGAGASAAGFAAGLGADFAAGLAADSDFAAGLAPGFAAGLAAGAPGLAAAFPGFAAGFLVESPPALPPAGAESANASFTRRTTGASSVEEADETNSPMSLSFSRTILLVVPSSFASSWTRGFATVLLSGFLPGQEETSSMKSRSHYTALSNSGEGVIARHSLLVIHSWLTRSVWVRCPAPEGPKR